MKYLLFVAFLLPFSLVSAQSDLTTNSSLNKDVLQVETYDVTMKKIPYGTSEVEGSSMLNNEFVKGIVKFKTGQQYNDVSLNLSLLNNQLYFIKDSTRLQFLNPVEYFALPVQAKGNAKTYTFKSGYPPIGLNSSEAFYQVLASGSKLQLLKFMHKKVREIYSYNSAAKKVYSLREQLYIYDVINASISEVSGKLNSLRKSLPTFAKHIDSYTSKNNSDFKNDEDIAALIEFINEQ